MPFKTSCSSIFIVTCKCFAYQKEEGLGPLDNCNEVTYPVQRKTGVSTNTAFALHSPQGELL